MRTRLGVLLLLAFGVMAIMLGRPRPTPPPPSRAEPTTLRTSQDTPASTSGTPVERVGQKQDDPSLARKLESLKVDLALVDMPFEDVLVLLRKTADVPILMDAAARDHVDMEQPVTITVKETALHDVLSTVLSLQDLSYVVAENKAILVHRARSSAKSGR
jgi:hypothetical protein